ncbi:MAG TPA: NADP-dependent oxidoreductase [Sphingomonadales bacterium]
MGNRRFILVRRPQGVPKESDFRIDETAIPEPGEGEIVLRNHYASIDPAMRGWMDDEPSYLPPVPLGAPMRATTIGRVHRSRHPDFREGQWVLSMTAIEDYACLAPNPFTQVIDETVTGDVTDYLYLIGAVGLTAYFATVEVGKPKAGETVLVTGAAGAVGSLVGQIAKLHGCRTIGIAGGPEKCARLVRDYGYDAAMDYRGKDVSALAAEIREAAPGGVNFIFENVGGPILDAGLLNIAPHGRVVLCGLISEYNHAGERYGTRQLWQLIVHAATIQGFILTDFIPRFAEGAKVMAAWAREGKLRHDEHIVEGIDNAYDALMRLFDGRHDGKLILKLA